jgi:hypothetical protein
MERSHYLVNRSIVADGWKEFGVLRNAVRDGENIGVEFQRGGMVGDNFKDARTGRRADQRRRGDARAFAVALRSDGAVIPAKRIFLRVSRTAASNVTRGHLARAAENVSDFLMG